MDPYFPPSVSAFVVSFLRASPRVCTEIFFPSISTHEDSPRSGCRTRLAQENLKSHQHAPVKSKTMYTFAYLCVSPYHYSIRRSSPPPQTLFHCPSCPDSTILIVSTRPLSMMLHRPWADYRISNIYSKYHFRAYVVPCNSSAD